MGHIDLDAARAARAEANGEARSLTFGGERFELPHEVTWYFGELLRENRLRDAVAELLGDQAARFWDLRPTVQDVDAFIEGISAEYTGHEAGESQASRSSSKRGTKTSRPGSRASTAKT